MFKIDDTNLKTDSNLSKYVATSDTGYDFLDSDFLRRVSQLPSQGYITLTAVDYQRLDLLAYKQYGDTAFWYIFLAHNDITSVEDLEPGMQLSYPSLDNIKLLINELKNRQAEVVTTVPAQELVPQSSIDYIELSEASIKWKFNDTRSRSFMVGPSPLGVFAEVKIEGDESAFTMERILSVEGILYYYVAPKKKNTGWKNITLTMTFTYKEAEAQVVELIHRHEFDTEENTD